MNGVDTISFDSELLLGSLDVFNLAVAGFPVCCIAPLDDTSDKKQAENGQRKQHNPDRLAVIHARTDQELGILRYRVARLTFKILAAFSLSSPTCLRTWLMYSISRLRT